MQFPLFTLSFLTGKLFCKKIEAESNQNFEQTMNITLGRESV